MIKEKESFNRVKKKKGFSLVEIMIAVSLIGILGLSMTTLFELVTKQKHQVATTSYFNTTLSKLDQDLQLSISNADKLIYPGIDNDFCEGMSGWTVSKQGGDPSRASLNDQNLDKKGNSEDGVERPGYTMSDVPGEGVMFCDQTGRINFIGLAKKYIPKKKTEHNVLVHYKNRRIKELTPVDNVTSELRELGSIPRTDKEHLQFVTPMNIGILNIKIDYPFNNLPGKNRAQKGTVVQTTMSNVDFQILFEYSGLTGGEQIRNIYRYYRTINLKNTIE